MIDDERGQLLDAGPVPAAHLIVAPGVNQQVIGETVTSPYAAPTR